MGDIEGGIGTLFASASDGTRQLPNDTVFLDGDPSSRWARAAPSSASTSSRRGPASRCRSTRSTSRSGGCSRSSRRRSSPACRASSSRPARRRTSPSALVELIVESGILPEGALQLLAGQRRRPARPPRACRTSSRSPARRTPPGMLRNHPAVLHGGVRLSVEADSLNCSILGPDVTAERPGVRPVRQGRRHRDDRQGRAEVHRDPARDRARPRWSTPSIEAIAARLATSHGRRPGRRGRPDGRAGQPRPARGGARRRRGAARRRPTSSTATPTAVDVVDADGERGAFLVARCCCAPTKPAPASRTTWRRSARSAP